MEQIVYTHSPAVRAFLAKEIGMLVNGRLIAAESGKRFETCDPADGKRLTTVPQAAASDIDLAAKAAHAAFHGEWGSMLPATRGNLLWRLADLVEQNADQLAELESIDNGKPAAFARAVDVQWAIDHLRYFAGWPTKIDGENLPVSQPDMHVYTRKQPVGVVGAIIPWNFPLLMCVWKLAPALAAGCTVVVKPAEQTPLTALRLGELVIEAGFPAGVVNICTGFGEEAGAALVGHPLIDKIAFTGSTAVGREIARRAADDIKHVSLELGGKSPNIVLPDADISRAAAGAAQAIFYETGQVCSAGSRLLVHRSILEPMIEALKAEVAKINPGRGTNAATTMGPLVSKEQHDRVKKYVEIGRNQGAEIVCGGRPIDGDLASGFFFEPTILLNVPDDATVCQEEIFGPVLVVQVYDDLDELIRRANASEYGLAAGVWTRDLSNAHKLAAALDAGSVWVNCYNSFDPSTPFGGFKKSGYGRDGGRAALDKFMHTKSVWMNLA
ncbi:MAG TPA: betaine-aldehyde dehydrogenase [Agrobacterium sp.]|uniref:aldehyde dehydrogenase family protein n=1 Tax=Rhizobium sp. TaxID=391 RepID=UPI000E8EA45C|nr:betaine-aldehyde dehydrogenase [Agrobacterium sp.]